MCVCLCVDYIRLEFRAQPRIILLSPFSKWISLCCETSALLYFLAAIAIAIAVAAVAEAYNNNTAIDLDILENTHNKT